MSELTEDFLKMMHIALTTIGILGIFFTFISYNIALQYESTKSQAIMLGDAVLADTCVAAVQDGKVMKGVLDQAKLDAYTEGCINYPEGTFTIKSGSFQKTIILGETDEEKLTTQSMPAAIRLTTGDVVPATLKVTL